MSRSISGQVPTDGGPFGTSFRSGPFRVSTVGTNRAGGSYTGVNQAYYKNSLAVPTGPQNSPVTASCILWRRVYDV